MPTLKQQPSRVKAQKPGIRSYLYIALLDIFNVIQVPTPGTGVGVNATITTDHTFKTTTPGTNGFIKIPLAGLENGKFNFKSEGNFPAMKEMTSFEANTVGLSTEQLEMIEAIGGQPCIALVTAADCKEPTVWQAGCECDPVIINWEFTTDNNILKLSGQSECAPNKYTGAITLQS